MTTKNKRTTTRHVVPIINGDCHQDHRPQQIGDGEVNLCYLLLQQVGEGR